MEARIIFLNPPFSVAIPDMQSHKSAPQKCFINLKARAPQRAPHFHLSLGVCIPALCGLRLTDLRRAAPPPPSCKQMQAKISIQLIAPDKAMKQSLDLKCVFVFTNLPDIHIIEVQTEQDLKAQRTRACVRMVLQG